MLEGNNEGSILNIASAHSLVSISHGHPRNKLFALIRNRRLPPQENHKILGFS